MAAKYSLTEVVELIDQYLEEEDVPESSDDELDDSTRCDYVDDNGEELLLPTSSVTAACNSDAILKDLLKDIQLNPGMLCCVVLCVVCVCVCSCFY